MQWCVFYYVSTLLYACVLTQFASDNYEYEYVIPPWVQDILTVRQTKVDNSTNIPKRSTRRLFRAVNNEKPMYDSYFQSLHGYDLNASYVEDPPDWIGKVIHNRNEIEPYVCTASCVQERIFITAARCLAYLKVNYTSILYLNHMFPIKAFVLPSRPTKQWFDDIGFLVVYAGRYDREWVTVDLFDGKRTDDHFRWFSNLKLSNTRADHKVIGYTVSKFLNRLRTTKTIFRLRELDVVVDINLCHEILAKNHNLQGFRVPCFHSCSIVEFKKKHPKCRNYLGTEGGALVNKKTNKLFGISTWGTTSDSSYELPVGFAVPNSDSFRLDFACAKKILNATILWSKGYFRKVCFNSSFTI